MTLWRWCALGGVLTILVGLCFSAVPEISACGSGGTNGVWASFQRIRSIADVGAIIRPDCSARLIPALKASMWLDALAFIPVYGMFLWMALLALRPAQPKWGLAGLVFLVAGMTFDQIEGGLLLHILNALPRTQAAIDVLIKAHLAKELALAGATWIVGAMLVVAGGRVRWSGLLIVAGASLALIFAVMEQAESAMGLLLAWLALAITAIGFGFGPSSMLLGRSQD